MTGKYLKTRNLGRYAPKFLAPAEGWRPLATDWQGLNFFLVGDDHLVRFFVFFAVVYFVFSVNAFFMKKIAKQNRLFRIFSKKPKHVSWKWL